jgi:hypothetical protein
MTASTGGSSRCYKAPSSRCEDVASARGSPPAFDLLWLKTAPTNGEPIGDHFPADDALLRTGDNEVIAGGVESPFVFSVFVA